MGTASQHGLTPETPLGIGTRPADWPCTIEIAWVDLGRPYPGSFKQEILANRGQKGRSRSTGTIQSCTATVNPLCRGLTGHGQSKQHQMLGELH